MNSVSESHKADCIVIGVGSMGSSACYHLAHRGYRVIGLEQFGIVHEQGSHGGETRIIRKAYFEHPDYIPLLQQAYKNWYALEKEGKESLFFRTGLLYAGPENDSLIRSVKSSAAQYLIPLEQLSLPETNKRFPAFQFKAGTEVLFEPEAGFLLPERAITAYTRRAKELGATIITDCKVHAWRLVGDGVLVETNSGMYHADRLVITAGPWSADLIPDIKNILTVTRQVLAWFDPAKPSHFTPDQFPCWLIVQPGQPGAYYGFPSMPNKPGFLNGIKAAYHHRGEPTRPDSVNRVVSGTDTNELVSFMKEYMPEGIGSLIKAKTCLYSYSPDEHFIIDHLPGSDGRVSIAWGFSGHGFKFSSAVGEILSDLAIDGKTDAPIGFLKADRFNH